MLLPAAKVSFALRDETDSITLLRLSVPSSTSAVAALLAAAALVPHLHAVCGCRCEKISVTYTDDHLGTADPTEPANPHGTFLWSCAGVDQYAVAALPGLLAELVTPAPDGDGITIDTADVRVADLIAEIQSGIWCNPFANDITTLEAAYIQVRDL